MKNCKDCRVNKSLKEFTQAPRYKDGYFPLCKTCKAKYDAKRYENKKPQILKQSKDYYDTNKALVQKRHANWRAENKIYIKNYLIAYDAEYPEKRKAKCRKYQAAKLNAVPKWLTKEQLAQMELMYKSCPVGYEVDHIMPLQGKNLSGLHVPWNLQHLPISENRKKSNKY